MAPAPRLAFVINDRDFVLAHCSDAGLGDVITSISKDAETAFDNVRNALRDQNFEIGAPCVIFVPFEDIPHKYISPESLGDESLETVFQKYLASAQDEYLVDYGEPSQVGGQTPAAIAKSDLENYAEIARKAGLSPIGLSTLFPKALRNTQPFFTIAQKTPARHPTTWLRRGFAAALIALAVGLGVSAQQGNFPFKLTEIFEQKEVGPQPADTRLFTMLRPPISLTQYTVPEFHTLEPPGSRQLPDRPDLTLPIEVAIAGIDVSIPKLPKVEVETDRIEDAIILSTLSGSTDDDDVSDIEEPEERTTQTIEVHTPGDGFLRPRARTAAFNALIASKQPSDPALAPPTAVLTSSIPRIRPASIGTNVQPSVSPPTVARVTPSAEGAEDAATTRGRTLSRNNLSLIGVFGKANNREAMFRTSGGRFVTRGLGDSINTWKIVAIGADQVRLAKGNRTETLRLP